MWNFQNDKSGRVRVDGGVGVFLGVFFFQTWWDLDYLFCVWFSVSLNLKSPWSHFTSRKHSSYYLFIYYTLFLFEFTGWVIGAIYIEYCPYLSNNRLVDYRPWLREIDGILNISSIPELDSVHLDFVKKGWTICEQ